MEQNDFKELPLEELLNKQKTFKTSLAFFCGILIVMFIVCFLFTLSKGFSAFTLLPFVFFPMLIGLINNLQKIKKEIQIRNSSI